MGNRTKAAGGALLRYVIGFALIIALTAAVSGISSYMSSHNKQFSKADYEDMNPLVEAGKELPTGKLGRLSIRWVLGLFAEEENSYSSYGIKFGSGKSYYYVAILDDLRIIAIQASDEAEIRRLEQMAADYAAADDVYTLESQDFEGKIEKLTKKDLKKYYDEAMSSAGFTKYGDMFSIQYLTLNTAAIPTQNTLMYLGIAAAVTVPAVLIFRARRKKNARPQEQPDDTPQAPEQPAGL